MREVMVRRLRAAGRLPQQASQGAAGYDLFAAEDVVVPARGRALVPTAIALGLPEDCEAQIRPRSGLALHEGIAAHFGTTVDDPKLCCWMRVLLYPGVAHCADGTGPQPGAVDNGPLSHALVQWVERGIPPPEVLVMEHGPLPQGAPPPSPSRPQRGPVIGHRPVCPYPKAAIYGGTGNAHHAGNWHCGGDLETPTVLKQDRPARHKYENGTGHVPPPYGPYSGAIHRRPRT
jgi:hypothetical protein